MRLPALLCGDEFTTAGSVGRTSPLLNSGATSIRTMSERESRSDGHFVAELSPDYSDRIQ